ncbi:uncharacterized protein LOC144654411 isoform X2 [Oculina patagonica]
MTKSCSSLVFLVLLTLFKGVEAGIDGGYSEWSEWSECSCATSVQQQSRTCTNLKPEGNGTTCEEKGLGPAKQSRGCICCLLVMTCLILAMLVTPPLGLLWCCICRKKQNPRQTAATSLVSRESTEGRHLPSYSEALVQQLHSATPQQSGSISETLQVVNPQRTSHSQAHRWVRLPIITRERSVPTASPPELLTVALPPSYSEEESPPPYSTEETSPPYSTEETPLPYSGEETSPPSYSTDETSLPYSREELPPPYSGEEPLSPYAVTTLV